ncbi:hypothetical protein [Luteimonas terrae]|uniref:Secreted protein n=1 Tax=Luteimonas terrae TaxID=1530191 RepID=A0ABU1XVN8_9GAMM|nr:hypothetical protein [Luteimonas terrae]MDR7192146.1 hypothetical protein [Luteimonas terrae]
MIRPRTLSFRLLPVLLLLALVACAAPAAPVVEAAPPPNAPVIDRPAAPSGVPNLDTRCRVDSDCVVKNVGSCCGYQPACVNADAQVDPQAVQADCARRGIAGVCGFVEIQSCACVNSRCEAPAPGSLLR